MMEAAALKVYSSRLAVGDDGELIGREAIDPGAELDRQTRSYMDNYPGLSYTEAFERVVARQENLALVAEYASPSYKPTPVFLLDQPAAPRYGDEIDRRTKAYMAQHDVDYATAMRTVLQADPALAKRYGEIANV